MGNPTENESERPRIHLHNGDNGGPYEDWIIGDAVGLRRLKEACDSALEHGESSENDLGDFTGVLMRESDWDVEQSDDLTSKLMGFGCFVIALVLIAIFIIGVRQVIHWTFG